MLFQYFAVVVYFIYPFVKLINLKSIYRWQYVYIKSSRSFIFPFLIIAMHKCYLCNKVSFFIVNYSFFFFRFYASCRGVLFQFRFFLWSFSAIVAPYMSWNVVLNSAHFSLTHSYFSYFYLFSIFLFIMITVIYMGAKQYVGILRILNSACRFLTSFFCPWDNFSCYYHWCFT